MKQLAPKLSAAFFWMTKRSKLLNCAVKMKDAIDLLEQFIPHFHEDKPKWDSWKGKLGNSVKTSTVTLFWYLSSGIDVMPLYFFGRQNRSSGFPKVDLFFYSDFGVVFNDPEELKRAIEKGKPPKLPSPTGRFVLKQFIPLQWKEEPKNAATGSSAGVNPSSFEGAPVYFLQIEDQSEESRIVQPVLFFRKSNQQMFKYFRDKKLSFHYICTVSDGCRPDNPEICPNNFLDSYLNVLKTNGCWITDHFNTQPPETLRKVAEIDSWGHYDVYDKSYCFSRK